MPWGYNITLCPNTLMGELLDRQSAQYRLFLLYYTGTVLAFGIHCSQVLHSRCFKICTLGEVLLIIV